MWFINLVCDTVGLLGGIFELLDDGVELVGLVLEGLHLLPDGVHGVAGAELSNKLSLTKRSLAGTEIKCFFFLKNWLLLGTGD